MQSLETLSTSLIKERLRQKFPDLIRTYYRNGRFTFNVTANDLGASSDTWVVGISGLGAEIAGPLTDNHLEEFVFPRLSQFIAPTSCDLGLNAWANFIDGTCHLGIVELISGVSDALAFAERQKQPSIYHVSTGKMLPVHNVEVLLTTFLPELLRAARFRLHDPHDAEDLAQEVFMAAFARYRAGHLIEDFRAYTFAILKTRAVDFIRQICRQRTTVSRLHPDFDFPDPESLRADDSTDSKLHVLQRLLAR